MYQFHDFYALNILKVLREMFKTRIQRLLISSHGTVCLLKKMSNVKIALKDFFIEHVHLTETRYDKSSKCCVPNKD